MTNLKNIVFREWRQYLAYLMVSFGVVLFTAILYFSGTPNFQKYLGGSNPIWVIVLVVLSGIVLLSILLSTSEFVIYRKEKNKNWFYIFGIALLFAMVVIGIDFTTAMTGNKGVFPKDMNVLFPESLLFYPTMGFIVEVIFHVLPLALFFLVINSFFRKSSWKNIIWFVLLAVALLEPTYQAIMSGAEQYPSWAAIYIWLHIFLINLFQLIIFKKYDFVLMYMFRLVYYLLWHIAWGHVRLDLFF